MNRISRSSVTVGLLVGLSMAGVLYLSGCLFPTVEDVNAMAVADHKYVADLREESNDLMTDLFDASNALMTQQHADMKPEVAEALLLLNQQNVALNAELKRLSGETNAALKRIVDETKAEGFDIMGTEGMAMLLAAFPGVGLWLRESRKPSRSAEKVDKLESEASVQKEKLTALLHDLATAAGTKDAIPSVS